MIPETSRIPARPEAAAVLILVPATIRLHSIPESAARVSRPRPSSTILEAEILETVVPEPGHTVTVWRGVYRYRPTDGGTPMTYYGTPPSVCFLGRDGRITHNHN